MPLKTKGRRGQRTIDNDSVASLEVINKIRKRLHLTQRQFPNHTIRKIMGQVSTEITEWLLNNPEGFQMPLEMGYLSLSKYILIPFREDRWEIVNRVENLSEERISARFKEIILKKYKRELSDIEIKEFMKRGKTVLVPMWFNHRNCSIKKAMCYKWVGAKQLKLKTKEIDTSKFYFQNFHNFYDYRIKNTETYE